MTKNPKLEKSEIRKSRDKALSKKIMSNQTNRIASENKFDKRDLKSGNVCNGSLHPIIEVQYNTTS